MVCFGGHFDFFLEEVGENHGPQQCSSSWGGSLVLLLRRFWGLGAPLAVSGTAFPLSATWLGYVDSWSRLFFGFGGAACSYFDDFDPFIVDLDGYS